MPCAQHIFLAIILGVELLLGHHFRVARIPYVYRGLFLWFLGFVFVLRRGARLAAVAIRSARGFFGLRNLFFPFGYAEKDRLTILGPGWFLKPNRAHACGKLRVGGGVVCMAGFGAFAEMRPRQCDLRRPFAMLVGFGAKSGEVRAVFEPCQAAVNRV